MSKSRSGRSVKIPNRFQPGRNNEAEKRKQEDEEEEPRKGVSDDELLSESREQTRLLRKLVRKAEELESVLCDVQAELAHLGVVKKPKSEQEHEVEVPIPISLQASVESIPPPPPPQREATPPLAVAEPSPAIIARLNTLCSDLINKDEAK